MMVKMRITLVISTFGAGGAERAMSVMANYWACRGEDVTLVTLASVEHDFYALHSAVDRVGLGVMAESASLLNRIWNNVLRVRCLRREIRLSRPDVMICFGDTTNVTALLASFGLACPAVICEQIDPRQYPIGLVWNLLRRIWYPQAVALVVVSAAMAKGWAEGVMQKQRIRIIPNPVYLAPTRPAEKVSRGQAEYTVVAMGRLVKQKGFDLLLEAFRLCAYRHPNWSLKILGEGHERHALEAMTTRLKLEERVTFLGLVRESSVVLRQADLFVMSSRFEGFPLALIEAMACGLPVISTDCPTGPSEIIRNDVDGILVPPGDAMSLADAMDRLMARPEERHRLAARATEVVDRFGTEAIMKLWDDLIADIAQVPRPPRVIESPSDTVSTGKAPS